MDETVVHDEDEEFLSPVNASFKGGVLNEMPCRSNEENIIISPIKLVSELSKLDLEPRNIRSVATIGDIREFKLSNQLSVMSTSSQNEDKNVFTRLYDNAKDLNFKKDFQL